MSNSVQPQLVKKITKLESILINRSMKQTDLIELIKYTSKQNDFNVKIPTKERISKIVTGKQTSYTIKTAVLISKALNVRLEDIVEDNLLNDK
jgi:DNA-binding Xre family transcriptional regulator